MDVIFGNLVSEKALNFLTPFALLVIGIFIETRYVSRVSMFTNALALFMFYHSISMSMVLGLLVNGSILLGIIGGFARLAKIGLPGKFYIIGWLSSSIVTGLLLFYGLSL